MEPIRFYFFSAGAVKCSRDAERGDAPRRTSSRYFGEGKIWTLTIRTRKRGGECKYCCKAR